MDIKLVGLIKCGEILPQRKKQTDRHDQHAPFLDQPTLNKVSFIQAK